MKKSYLLLCIIVVCLLLGSCNKNLILNVQKIKYELVSNNITTQLLMDEDYLNRIPNSDKVIWEFYNQGRIIKLGKKLDSIDYFEIRAKIYLFDDKGLIDSLYLNRTGRIKYNNQFYKGSFETMYFLRGGVMNFPHKNVRKVMDLKYPDKNSEEN